MKLSTSLNVYSSWKEKASYETVLAHAKQCGFTCFDFNPTDYRQGETFYTAENWEENVRNIKRFADENGLRFMQSHAFCWCEPAPEDVDYQLKKSIKAAALAGVPWTVMHPWQTKFSETADIIAENIKLFAPYIAYAKELGVGIAIENCPRRIYWYGEELPNKAFYCAEDLIALVDALQEQFGNVGICWDTGHAFLASEHQEDEIRKLSNRLKVLHVADNDGQYDDHTAVYMGYINWDKVVQALLDIGYQGTFNYEAHNYTRGLPTELTDDSVTMMYKIGKYLLGKHGCFEG